MGSSFTYLNGMETHDFVRSPVQGCDDASYEKMYTCNNNSGDECFVVYAVIINNIRNLTTNATCFNIL